MILQLEIFHKSGKGRLSYRFCPKKRPRDVSPGLLPPSSRKVKFQNDPLIVVSIGCVQGEWAWAKTCSKNHSPERRTRMNIINTYYTFIGCNYDIFSQFLFDYWLGKINNFHLNRKVKQQNPSPPPPKRLTDVSPDIIDKSIFPKESNH